MDLSIEARFWKYVEKGPECWLWIGGGSGKGYGAIRIPTGHVYAHRAVWELTYGPIPAGLFVCHHCDVRRCVRPDHLFLGTQQDNLDDASRKGRMRRGEASHFAKLTTQDVRQLKTLKLSGVPTTELAARYSITFQQVYRICKGTSWKHEGGALSPI